MSAVGRCCSIKVQHVFGNFRGSRSSGRLPQRPLDLQISQVLTGATWLGLHLSNGK